jgi:phosphoenolpyruvate carboxykinase (ATP)
MADPYAQKDRRPATEKPDADAALAEIVRAREGLPVASCEALASVAPSRFVAVLLRDDGLLPPIARLRPEQAVMLLAGTAADAEELERALAAARGLSSPLLMLKQGLVAGPPGSEGAVAVDAESCEGLLDAALGGSVEWERDPDFGYEVAGVAEGLDPDLVRALCPRIAYADHDRVYEHAELVVDVKRERHTRISRLPGAPVAVLEASGWPIAQTGQSWKD